MIKLLVKFTLVMGLLAVFSLVLAALTLFAPILAVIVGAPAFYFTACLGANLYEDLVATLSQK